MSEDKLVPCIRFKGFVGEWENRSFKDIVTINSGKDYKHLSKGDIPVYGTGGLMLYVNDKLSEKDAIGIGRKGTIDRPQFLKAPFWTVDTLFFMVPKKKFNIYFVYCLSEKTNWKKYDESTGLPSLSKSTISKISSFTPPLKEQQKIGNLFAKLDQLLDLQQQKLDQLELLKKVLLQKLFPKQRAKIPELRFKGFAEEWKIEYLKDIGIFKSGTGFPEIEQGGAKGTPFYKVSDLGNNLESKLSKANNYVTDKQIENNKWKVIDSSFNGAIVFAKIGAAIFLNRKRMVKNKFLMDNNLMAYIISDRVNCDFIVAYLQKINFSRFAQVGALPSINKNDLEKIGINIPACKPEQQKIGNLLAKVDRLIELENKKFSNLKLVKKSLLQNMFVE